MYFALAMYVTGAIFWGCTEAIKLHRPLRFIVNAPQHTAYK